MAALAAAVKVSPVVAWVLLNRGISDPDPARRFLNPALEQLKPEQQMADMDRAVSRIEQALKDRETIGVHGDYDVDGITGAALLVLFFRSLGAAVVWHIPHRQREGYGMKPLGVEDLKSKGASLIVTVDCGISDHEAVDRAIELGMDVIIVDHHQVPEQMPRALAILNHNRPDCPFQGEPLSGVGTAFYLAAALRSHLRGKEMFDDKNCPNLLHYLDLVALGTVADLVPMTGMNRVLVHYGLEQINAGRRPGIIQLRRVAGSLNKPVGVGQLAFGLAPRINAAGRLDSGEPSLRLLLTDNEKEAGLLADELENLNLTRRRVEEIILAEAMRIIDSTPGMEQAPAIVVAAKDWHIGVIGIAASRITESFHRPSVVIGINEGMGKGSLRSVPGIDIYQALRRCETLLEAFGGHKQAAGITIKEENIERFEEAFKQAIMDEAGEGAFEAVFPVDADWPIHRVDHDLVKDLARMRPHGIGNPEPVFRARGVLVKWAREAKNNTLIMGVQEKHVTLPAVAFRLAHRLPEPGSRLDIAYTPFLDDWKDNEELKLRVKEFMPA